MLSFPHDRVINKHIYKKVFAWCVVCTDRYPYIYVLKKKNGTTIYSIYYRIKVKKKKSWYIYDHTAWILQLS